MEKAPTAKAAPMSGPRRPAARKDDALVQGVDHGVEDGGRKAERSAHTEGEEDVPDLAYCGVGHYL
jgi:hypothetical protein